MGWVCRVGRVERLKRVTSAACAAITLAAVCTTSGQAPKTAAPKNRLFPAQELGLIEPPDRDQWQPSDWIMDELRIADGATVAEVGAGGGWFVIRLARRVERNGVVYAEDVQSAMVQLIRRNVQRENLSNVKTVLGTPTDPKLPPGIDAVLIVDAYREMACAAGPSCQDPVLLLKNVARSLKPRGRLGIVDFNRGEGGPGPAPDERVDPEAIIRAAAAAGLRLERRENLPPFEFQYLLVFGKADSSRVSQ
jgi:SAM-dependent methyltransferase